jgi:serine/threonine protein kinase
MSRICPECDFKTEDETCPKDGRGTIDESIFSRQRQDPNLGLRIADKYVVEERLGRGGMAAVYRARHLQTGGNVAVKLMRPELEESESAIKRFYIEAQNTHKLRHSNTVTVSDFGHTKDGILYLVMEYVQGRSLSRALKDEGRLSAFRAVRIASQMLKSLGEAHENGIVHRDVKPDNVMLLDQFGEKDVVKVVDFGISRAVDGTGASTRDAIGTPRYMAPEQWRARKVDGRTDLYSVGVILYQMLTGSTPFGSDARGNSEPIAFMHAHLNDAPPPLLTKAPGVCPPELAVLVMSLLEKEPDKRPTDARAVLDILGELQATQPLARELVPLDGETALPPSGSADSGPRRPSTDSGPMPGEATPKASAGIVQSPGDDMSPGPQGAAEQTLLLDDESPLSPSAPAGTEEDDELLSSTGTNLAGLGLNPPGKWLAMAMGAIATITLAGLFIVLHGGADGETGKGRTAAPAPTATSSKEKTPAKAVSAVSATAIPEVLSNEKPEVKRVTPPPNTPKLNIVSNPPGAAVRIQETGETLGKTPLSWVVPESVRIRLELGTPVTLVFEVGSARQERKLRAEDLSGKGGNISLTLTVPTEEEKASSDDITPAKAKAFKAKTKKRRDAKSSQGKKGKPAKKTKPAPKEKKRIFGL